MNGELLTARGSLRAHIYWGIFYVILVALIVTGLYIAGNRIRTHVLPVGQVQLSIPYSTYVVGEVVTFTIKNNFNSPIYLANECPGEPLNVYRQENNQWVRVHDTASSVDCPSEQRQIVVPPSGAVNGNFSPWHNLFATPGKYRIVAYVEYYNALPYQDLTIIAQPPKPVVKAAPKASSITTPTVTKPTTTTTTVPNAIPNWRRWAQ
jgi:hypothetical protein